MTWARLFEISIYHGYILQILIAEWMFWPTLRQRTNLAVRLMVGLPIYCACAVVVPNLIAYYISGLFSLVIFLISLLLHLFLFESEFTQILYCCVGAQLIQNLSYNIENLIYCRFPAFFDEESVRWFCLSVLVMIGVYLGCNQLFIKRLKEQEKFRIKGIHVFVMSVIIALFVYIMQFLFQRYGIDKLWITRPPLILCCLFGMCVQFGLLELTNERAEKQLMERLIKNERRQYEVLKDSMDTIDRKAHDLKHQIAHIRALGIVDQEELTEIESAVGAYEMCYCTGNRALDAILTDKNLRCRQKQIELNVIAQGEALNFLRSGEVASLFGNALDNAIECEERIPDADKRCIALNVFKRHGLVCIRVENYCTDEPAVINGLPVTTKADRSLHGFGLKSIQYTVSKYNGTMNISTEHNLFVLSILIPSKPNDAHVH